MSTSGKPLDAYRSLGFWVLAPESQINDRITCVDNGSIEQKIRSRIEAYEPDWREKRLDPWQRDWLSPVMERIGLRCLPWEEVIKSVRRADPAYGAALQEFYDGCLTFNRPASRPDSSEAEPG